MTINFRTMLHKSTSCHDSESVQAHVDINTSVSGFESCEVCHGAGSDFEVELAHKVHFQAACRMPGTEAVR